MLTIYKKNLQKSWIIGISLPLIIIIFIPFIASLWPEISELFSDPVLMQLLENPIYRVMLGEVADLTTWQGMYFMYIFMILEWTMIFATIFIPARLLASEMDNNTLDVMLSYPIPRWRYALEKFSVFLTYNLLYPVLILVTTFFVNIIMINIDFISAGEAVDLVVVGYATIGSWSLFFALGALSFLCGTIFLESNKAMALSALVILGQYMMERFGGIVESINFLQDFSLFHYLIPATINRTGTIPSTINFSLTIGDLINFSIPISDLIPVLSVGLIATLGALYVFQKRELT